MAIGSALAKLKAFAFMGNPNLKKVGTVVDYSEDQIAELRKCINDPKYFIRTYCKIVSLDRGLVPFKLFPYQERFIDAMHENRKVISMQPRQSGKTQVVAAYILWYSIFNESKTVAILANKAAVSKEILSRYQAMYETIPVWMQQGIKIWNKGDIELENGSKVFTGATSKSGIRGKSCVTGDTRVCVENDDNFYYVEIDSLVNSCKLVNIEDTMKKHVVYKTTNSVNGKIYYGYHSINESGILRLERGKYSCFVDGYLGSGKLIRAAIQKYGPENFEQEIVDVFTTREDAETLEAKLANPDFVVHEDNYNLAIGGNVRAYPGINNPFYGRTHTQETIDKIQATREANGLPTYQTTLTNTETGVLYRGYGEALAAFGFSPASTKNIANQRRMFIVNLVARGKLKINNPVLQQKSIERYDMMVALEDSEPARKLALAQSCRSRFSGKRQGFAHIQKRVDGHKKWISENPDLHAERMNKINTNPDKIAKTAETHRGMKRSEETRERISKAKLGSVGPTKNKTTIWNPETGKVRYITKDEPVPAGWVYGRPPRPSSDKKVT